MAKIGFTSTIPQEVIFASGNIPLDLNNLFITDKDPVSLIEIAEAKGFPRSSCSWIKGIYGAIVKYGIDTVVGVIEGDCSNTFALMEILSDEGVSIIPFRYPKDGQRSALFEEIGRFCKILKVDWKKVMQTKRELDFIRRKLKIIDRLTYLDRKVCGFENFIYLLSSSDMEGDFKNFYEKINSFLKEAVLRATLTNKIRLVLLGVPPIFSNLHRFVFEKGADFVFNEIPRQFSMPYLTSDLVLQYSMYTYPYHIEKRLKDIEIEITKRKVSGIIHYVQSFCFRQIEDILIKKRFKNLPILTLEGDRPKELDGKERVQVEAFLESIQFKM